MLISCSSVIIVSWAHLLDTQVDAVQGALEPVGDGGDRKEVGAGLLLLIRGVISSSCCSSSQQGASHLLVVLVLLQTQSVSAPGKGTKHISSRRAFKKFMTMFSLRNFLKLKMFLIRVDCKVTEVQSGQFLALEGTIWSLSQTQIKGELVCCNLLRGH